jgi:NAD(P)-dependent dehydrogenase (short-subunit alcohol dehydrogenase family)
MSESQATTILSRRFPAKRAFITGAASGLGRAIATELASDGWQLGLLDLSATRLAEAEAALHGAGGLTFAYAGDVAHEEFVAASVADFVRRTGGLDVMVNNAGVAVAGALEATSVTDWRWITDINLFGVVWGCQAALAHMRPAGAGLLLNTASSAGFAAAPRMSAYNATKAAVISLSETAAAELAGTGIQVSVAMPGFFSTHLLETMRAPEEERSMARRIMATSGKDATAAARAILGRAARGDLHIVWPREYRLAWRLKRLFPAWFVRRVGRLTESRLARGGPPRG